jgi:Protein of unknown function (DUF2911)
MIDRRSFLIAGLGTVAVPAFGQFYGRSLASPPMVTQAMIGGKQVTVNYFAPSMRGRKIMGGLVPYGTVWCTGANYCTTITSDDAGIEIGPMKLAAGTYAIWTLPNEKEWKVIVNKNTHAFHLDYDESADIGRTAMDLKALSDPVEQMRIEVRTEGDNKGRFAVMWERTEASFVFTLV